MLRYGNRYGTKDPKASGYFGELQTPIANNVATEYSVGQNINGKGLEMPSIVPTLTRDELEQTLIAAGSGNQPSQSVYDKSLQYAKDRIAQGRSPFWSLPEKQFAVPSIHPSAQENILSMIARAGK
jgi:hypothetical protein